VKILIRLILAVLALLFIVLVLVAVFLPRIVASAAVRTRIEGAAREALGRELRYRELGVGLFPPSLLVEAPQIAGEGPDAPAALEAERIALRVALLPLLSRAVVVDSLRIDGAALRLVRTADGVELPFDTPAAAGDAGESAPEPGGGAGSDADAPVALAIRAFELRGARVLLEDRTLRPPVTWDLRDIEVDASGEALDQPIQIDASLALASGGTLAARGTAMLSGELDLEVDIDALALGPLRAYVGADGALEGLLAGTVRVQGPAASPTRLSADLAIRGARFALRDIAVAGAVEAQAELAGSLAAPTGRFDLDASAAELRYGGAFSKPSGVPATISGEIVTDERGALGVDDVTLRIRNLDATGRVRVGPPLRVEIDSAVADLDGAESLIAALAAAPPTGRVRAEKLRFVSDPPALVGVVHFDGLAVTPSNLDAPILVRGALVAQGTELRSRDLEFVAGGQPLAVDVRLLDLFGTLRYEIAANASGADSNALMKAFAGKPDTLYGPLSLQGNFRGAVDPTRPFLDALNGEVEFSIDQGRLVGASLLEATFGELGALRELGSLAVDTGRLFAGEHVDQYYSEEFERIYGSLRVNGSTAYAEPLALLYPSYSADLAGTVHLTDLSLDMKGRLTLSEEIDASIAKEVGAESYQPKRRVIPLASVRGTLDAPDVKLAGNAGADFAARYAKDLYGNKLRGLIDRELGEGAGSAIEGALEGLLRGNRPSE
jgi:hypothetical protein